MIKEPYFDLCGVGQKKSTVKLKTLEDMRLIYSYCFIMIDPTNKFYALSEASGSILEIQVDQLVYLMIYQNNI